MKGVISVKVLLPEERQQYTKAKGIGLLLESEMSAFTDAVKQKTKEDEAEISSINH